ncbi:unnamed protein product [Clonostachys rosea f. rosea IK726]|jgi:hypothetical protein|uniref:DUF2470 domain-containing protein n=2 Tax=Bionectria ochroleuca TaxID=29856 RepID=A0A0B7JLZ0_BIOOC|nr:unnamed protein product [Clonostachys rosea f. rosea IK726]
MATNAAEQRRQRIIKHMNDGHLESLQLYLQVYSGVEEASAKSGCELVDVSLSHLLIRTGDGKEHTVQFAPPLDAWGEIRPRLVEMDALARAKLGIAPLDNSDDPDSIVITEWLAPRGFDAVVLGSICWYFFSYFTLPLLVPGTWGWKVLEAVFPGGPAWYCWIVKAIFWPVVGIHTAEAFFFDRTRMVNNGVQRFSRVWWLWVGNCWMEGYTAWKRVDALIAAKKEEKRLKKH